MRLIFFTTTTTIIPLLILFALLGLSWGQSVPFNGQSLSLTPCLLGNYYQTWSYESGANSEHKIFLENFPWPSSCIDCSGCEPGIGPHTWTCLSQSDDDTGYDNQEYSLSSNGLIASLSPNSNGTICIQAFSSSGGGPLDTVIMNPCNPNDSTFIWNLDTNTGFLTSAANGLCLDATYYPPPAIACYLPPYSAYPWCNTSLTAGERTSLLLNAMSQDDKDSLLHGSNGPYVGNTDYNAKYGIPALTLNDGPQGFRGIPGTSTQFPCALNIAATFDPAAANAWGEAMGKEFVGKGANVQLGPGMNVARVPVNGRNFEYISGEDPRLGRVLAGAAVIGIQSTGTIANAKHYINNNQETNRTTISANLDERTRMEIYAQPFWGSVDAGVWSIMCSYNRINDTYACENDLTLNTELKSYMGFPGWVMSDWGATHSTVPSANNGLDQQMPDAEYYGAALEAAVAAGQVTEEAYNDHVSRVLLGMFSMGLFDRILNGTWTDNVTSPEANLLTRQLAIQGSVLLTNYQNLLPLTCSKVTSIAFIGDPAYHSPVTGGGGSGSVDPAYVVSPLQGVENYFKSRGYNVSISYYDGPNFDVAKQLAAKSQVVISVLATNSGEGSDRPNLDLPQFQVAMTQAVAEVNPNTIALVIAPGPVLLPFADQVSSLLLMFLPGQEEGNAFAEILCGSAAPEGRLPLTIPNFNNEVNFSVWQYPGVANEEYYTEKLEVGYRWYNANKVVPHFPFGYGLTYTSFAYSNLIISGTAVSATVTNTGSRAGTEVVQLYLTYPPSAGEPPVQLRYFQKIHLASKASRVVNFQLIDLDFSIWDVSTHSFQVVAGSFTIYVGSSSLDLPLSGILVR